MKGKIEPDYYITCARCEYGCHIGENVYSLAVRSAKEQGWVQVIINHRRLWVCKDCKKAS